MKKSNHSGAPLPAHAYENHPSGTTSGAAKNVEDLKGKKKKKGKKKRTYRTGNLTDRCRV